MCCARGVFKEPHAAENDHGLAMSTANVGNYLGAGTPSPRLNRMSSRFPTKGATNRIAAVLICEKEGFDDLLMAEQLPEGFDLALMSTKGVSARAARDLAGSIGAPCFTLHDLDKNGFVMAAGFPDAIDLGIRMEDVDEWDLEPEGQYHSSPRKTYRNLVRNGATDEEAEFVSQGRRVELNMFTGPQFVEFVERKLEEHGVEKVMPDDRTLALAWRRAHQVRKINELIRRTDDEGDDDIPPAPGDLADRIREEFDDDDDDAAQPWDVALSTLVYDDELIDDEDEPKE